MTTSLSHADARRVLDAGIARAEEIGQPMNVAVVDDGGHLLAFGRMDGAIKASIDISTRKAVTSVLMALPTAALFATQDGRQVSLGVVQDNQFAVLARVLGLHP